MGEDLKKGVTLIISMTLCCIAIMIPFSMLGERSVKSNNDFCTKVCASENKTFVTFQETFLGFGETKCYCDGLIGDET